MSQKNKRASNPRRARKPRIAKPGKVAPSIPKRIELPIARPQKPEADKSKLEFWETLVRALEAEPREPLPIQGRSGVTHEILALGVDEKRQRIILVSPYPDALSSAMMQSDLQATFPDQRVLVARPIAADVGHIVRTVLGNLGVTSFTVGDLKRITAASRDQLSPVLERYLGSIPDQLTRGFSVARLNLMSQAVSILQQLSTFGLQNIAGIVKDVTTIDDLTIDLTGLLQYDSAVNDRQFGICPIPLYGFSEEEAVILTSKKNFLDARDILASKGIAQYFFPPRDQLVLGGVDRGIARMDALERMLEIAQRSGHLITGNEIVGTAKATPGSLREMLDALIELKMLRQIEYDVEIDEKGRLERIKIKLAPREGVVSKAINLLRLGAAGVKILHGGR